MGYPHSWMVSSMENPKQKLGVSLNDRSIFVSGFPSQKTNQAAIHRDDRDDPLCELIIKQFDHHYTLIYSLKII